MCGAEVGAVSEGDGVEGEGGEVAAWASADVGAGDVEGEVGGVVGVWCMAWGLMSAVRYCQMRWWPWGRW
ncbi:hypothetical protein CP982_00455 [Streptomyces spectabilis]|uniref:Uncharacterized protein n=1 Tax=Streptomyces spectabilis TaxID=68270 RepID=A0A5P2WX73_STRST|nr:hypothetical protein CP982_00455 [Streptomyces spectabilis]